MPRHIQTWAKRLFCFLCCLNLAFVFFWFWYLNRISVEQADRLGIVLTAIGVTQFAPSLIGLVLIDIIGLVACIGGWLSDDQNDESLLNNPVESGLYQNRI
jgi:hypothetical protein